MGKRLLLQGNAAMTEGAIAAGARFYAGYPITPSSEVAETSSVRLPQVGGVFLQMEDEIGSVAAMIGAVCAGKKAYSATSGPGFSLMQENIGLATMMELPMVIINVQRSGPSTGLATKPSQGDVMQARYGIHGDHESIVISPSSVQDCFDLIVRAFNLAEKYRTPVIFLSDEIIGHLREQVVIRDASEIEVVERMKPDCSPEDYLPFRFDGTVTPLAVMGSGYTYAVNGSNHARSGRTQVDPKVAESVIRHLSKKIEDNKDDICMTREYCMEDAEYVIIAYGGVTRAALQAMKDGREKGLKIGVLQCVTVWPVPDKKVREAFAKAKAVFVPELNLGQYRGELAKYNVEKKPLIGINSVDSYPIMPAEILSAVEEVAK